MMNEEKLKREALKVLAKEDFFVYCHAKSPNFYRTDRPHLKELCRELQEFYEDEEEEVLVINLPPRFGKSRTAGNFVEWVFGKDKTKKVMTGSYNETLSTVFSKSVRNTISEVKADEERLVYSDIFPGVAIKYGDAAMNLWSLEGEYNNYLATSPGGTATGFGSDIMLLDDMIKNAEEASNAAHLEKIWDWFSNTMMSRLEEGGKIIVIMTRWATEDLAGKILNHFTKEGAKIRHVNMKALQDDGSMLCPAILSRKSYNRKVATLGKEIAEANYNQNPIDLEGQLYNKPFKEYEANAIPLFKRVFVYGDTADEGDDYLAAYVIGETFDREGYMLDVLYTKESMDVTETEFANMIVRNDVNVAYIESNGGGRGFARNVKRILIEKLNHFSTVIKWFHQSKNKKARIISNSTFIMDSIYFPRGWQNRWPELYLSLKSYQKEGKNKHDDAEDALTGVAEVLGNKIKNTSSTSDAMNKVKKLGL
ncbi:phage terminase large subunit [Listeria monocytogenes]|nr:phage terminase large subunit [Listeria monocytogenes]ELF4246354.1 phage terminase large subunit [Listeria monocytogenes]